MYTTAHSDDMLAQMRWCVNTEPGRVLCRQQDDGPEGSVRDVPSSTGYGRCRWFWAGVPMCGLPVDLHRQPVRPLPGGVSCSLSSHSAIGPPTKRSIT